MLCLYCNILHDSSTMICPTTGRVLRCPKCASLVEDRDATSCSQCGEFFPQNAPALAQEKSIQNKEDNLVCPKCKFSVALVDDICPNCGQYLKGIFEQKEVKEEPKVEKPIRKKQPERAAVVKMQDEEKKRVEVIPVSAPARSNTPTILILFGTLLCCCFACIITYSLWPGSTPTGDALTPAVNFVTPTKTRFPAPPTFTRGPAVTLTPAITFTPTIDFTPTITLTPTVPPPTGTPTLPSYEEITSQNIERISSALSLQNSDNGLGIAFSPDGHLLATAGDDGSIRIWDTYYGTLRSEFTSNMKSALTVAFSPDGKFVYASGGDFIIYEFNVKTGEVLKRFLGHSGWVDSIIFHPSDNNLMASTNGSVILWDIQTGKIIRTFPGDSKEIAFMPDGNSIAIPEILTVRTGVTPYEVIVHNPAIRVRDLKTGDTDSLYSFSVNSVDPGSITGMAFSPDGQYIAAGGPENTVWWGSRNGSSLSKLSNLDLTAKITDISFSPSGDLLAASSTDFTIKIWDFHNGSLIATLEGHKDVVRYISFSPDGKKLASSSDDGTIIIWRIK